MNIAVTGATGFIGKSLCFHLTEKLGARVIAINRHGQLGTPGLSAVDSELVASLTGTDCLVHLAARAHTKNATPADFERDNQQLCQRIAKIVLAARIPRVIYLSSIKVHGESTTNRAPFSAEDPPAPQDEYGRSKLASENILKTAFTGSATQLIIIRPPLVYGSHNKGNLASLQRLIKLGVPLPFAGIDNKRDLVSIDNLCSLIALCCTTRHVANHTFLVSDGLSRSIADIVKMLAEQAHTNAYLYPLPSILLRALTMIKPTAMARLTGDLQVDIRNTTTSIGWTPQ